MQTPDPAKDGVCSWRIADLCGFVETRFDKEVSLSGMWGILKRMGLSHQKTRPVHPKSDSVAQDAFKKKGFWRLFVRPILDANSRSVASAVVSVPRFHLDDDHKRNWRPSIKCCCRMSTACGCFRKPGFETTNLPA
ncbi:MAG: helix-turn-helix domain-containing protein [Geminicoccales bacterium]